MIRMTTAMTRRTWIRLLLTWKAKNPRAHAITRMIKIVSSMLTSFFLNCFSLVLLNHYLEGTMDWGEAASFNAIFMPGSFRVLGTSGI
jgi:hypothetical protein